MKYAERMSKKEGKEEKGENTNINNYNSEFRL